MIDVTHKTAMRFDLSLRLLHAELMRYTALPHPASPALAFTRASSQVA
ncbi:hypothetical protein [Neorhizobium galegae]|nr:hypothetical protein [Neorhizobium galegae]